MSSEQHAQDPMAYRGVANPRRQRLSALRVRRTAAGAADRREGPEAGESHAVRPQ